MLYDLTLRDLSIVGTTFAVCLRLYGYQETIVTGKVNAADGFLSALLLGKHIGYRLIALGQVRTINAVEPPDDETFLRDADGHELRREDIMYRVANEYDTHQEMREAIRVNLIRLAPKLSPASLKELHRDMCLLTLWMTMHDPEFANGMRQNMLDSFKEFRRAALTMACSKYRAYVRSIGPAFVDLTEALRQADESDRSQFTTHITRVPVIR